MKFAVVFLMLLGSVTGWAGTMPPVQTVFIILLENDDWSDLRGSTNAPYINSALLPMASFCEEYHNPPGLHPSLPNYIWLEAGTNFGILDNNDPSVNHLNTTNHLAVLLDNAGISWRSYPEDISGTNVPLYYTGGYAPRHNPFVYFDDVTGTNNPNYAYGIAHNRPYQELAADLTNNAVARYNFITPNICHDGHDPCAPLYNPVRQADNWLAAEIPKILNSSAYRNGGAIFITWDETLNGDAPIGMIVLSPLALGGGYFNQVPYSHSSTLRTFQKIFGVTPWLGDAANANDLSDLFQPFGLNNVAKLSGGDVQLTATGVIPGWTSIIQASTDLATWVPISTNVPTANTFTVIDHAAANLDRRFYRILQAP